MKRTIIIFMILLWFGFLSGCQTELIPSQKEKCQLLDVVDGDTITVMYFGKKEKVRMIGIDTPESVHSDSSKNNQYGTLASDYTYSLLQDIDYVYLEFDESMYDNYDRILAYVYLTEDAAFEESLNYILVSEGFAINKEFEPNTKYADVLEGACIESKNQSMGLWKEKEFLNLWSFKTNKSCYCN